MRFLVGLFLAAFLAVACHNSYAQITSSAIQGKVLTEEHAPANGATIILLKYGDSSIVNSTVADKKGLFQFSNIRPENYLLLISVVGYDKSYSGPHNVLPGQVLEVPPIFLHVSARQLGQVSVVGTRPEVEVKPGKMILNVKNSVMADGKSAFDILRGSPGVRVDNNNNISIIGRQNALVTIDGKSTNLSGEDLVGILKSMQSNTIDRIELITASSAKSDASAGGIVNIVLNKGNNVGANASITISAGYGKYAKGTSGIVFNDRTDKINIFGSYNYSHNKSYQTIVTDRAINYHNLLSNYDADYNSVPIEENHTFSFGTDYFISPRHTLGFLVNGFIVDRDVVKNNSLEIYNRSILDSTIEANSKVLRHVNRINYNVNYTGKLDSAGKTLSADVNYTTNNRASSEYITNDFFDSGGNMYRAPLLLQNLSPSNIHIWLSSLDFTDPLSKTSKLEAGIKYSYVTSNNDLVFGSKNGPIYIADPAYSNHFIYTENVNTAYVNYESKFNRFTFATGLRAEQTIAKGNSVTLGQLVVDRNYTDLFPHALLTYINDNKNQFSLSYQRDIARPRYEDLNPFLYYTDLYDYRAGNPNLKPEYSHTIQLIFNHAGFVTTLYSSVINNAYHFPLYEQNDSTKRNITTNKNLGTIHNYGVRFFAPVTFANWWNSSFYIDAIYSRYVAYPENGNLNKGTPDIYFDTNNTFTISNTITADFLVHYESPNFYGISQFKATYFVNAGIGKQLFNKRGSLRLTVTDLFNTLRDRSHTNYQNLDMSVVDKKESQVIRLTFTYRFGKTTIKAASAHNTGNRDEQRRIGVEN